MNAVLRAFILEVDPPYETQPQFDSHAARRVVRGALERSRSGPRHLR